MGYRDYDDMPSRNERERGKKGSGVAIAASICILVCLLILIICILVSTGHEGKSREEEVQSSSQSVDDSKENEALEEGIETVANADGFETKEPEAVENDNGALLQKSIDNDTEAYIEEPEAVETVETTEQAPTQEALNTESIPDEESNKDSEVENETSLVIEEPIAEEPEVAESTDQPLSEEIANQDTDVPNTEVISDEQSLTEEANKTETDIEEPVAEEPEIVESTDQPLSEEVANQDRDVPNTEVISDEHALPEEANKTETDIEEPEAEEPEIVESTDQPLSEEVANQDTDVPNTEAISDEHALPEEANKTETDIEEPEAVETVETIEQAPIQNSLSTESKQEEKANTETEIEDDVPIGVATESGEVKNADGSSLPEEVTGQDVALFEDPVQTESSTRDASEETGEIPATIDEHETVEDTQLSGSVVELQPSFDEEVLPNVDIAENIVAEVEENTYEPLSVTEEFEGHDTALLDDAIAEESPVLKQDETTIERKLDKYGIVLKQTGNEVTLAVPENYTYKEIIALALKIKDILRYNVSVKNKTITIDFAEVLTESNSDDVFNKISNVVAVFERKRK